MTETATTAAATTETTAQPYEGQESAISHIDQLAPDFVAPWRWRQRHLNDPIRSSWAVANHRPNGHFALQLGLKRTPITPVSFTGYFDYPYQNALPFGWHDWEIQFDLGPVTRRPQGTQKVDTWVFLKVLGPSYVRPIWYRANSQTNPRLLAGSSTMGRPLLPGKYTIQVGGLVLIHPGASPNHYGEVIADRILHVRGPADTGGWSALEQHSKEMDQGADFETYEIGPQLETPTEN